jgi:hypothetical protein
MARFDRRWRAPLLAICLLVAAVPLARAQSDQRCFAETQQCIGGRFRQYWEQNGGLPVFGLAITAAGPELNRDTNQTYQTQWLERNRFEAHPENVAPYDVLLGRLGDDRLRQVGIDWQTLPKADPSAPHYFAASGHAIAHEPFWRYWSTHGLELGDRGVSERESLALFGLPIGEPQVETNSSGDTVLTQWFERARFEDHGDKGVLLGLLGNEVRANAAPSAPEPSPEPSPSPSPAPGPLPPSYNACREDPNADRAPNSPVRMTVNKRSEVVRLVNVTDSPAPLDGWRICSIRGNQLHATLEGVLAGGATLDVVSEAGDNIWNNNDRDDGALYDANGALVSYWKDEDN